ncbi:tRNA nucleotidyltransferase [Pseudozyma hubeiensis]|nr:tRNA nucleotidyltransferase [Pseudozyma hubeiensis]
MSTSSNSAAHATASIPSASSSAAVAATTSKNQLYALASRVPLIKSHSISLPKPVKLPPDLHPLPADISAYFVYPFSLESYVLDPNTPSSNTVDQLLAKHKQYLENREKDKEDRQREMLRKVAPGWHGDVLMPTNSANARKSLDVGATLEQAQSQSAQQLQQQQGAERTPLDDLADHLAQLDALNSSATPTSSSHPQNQNQYLQQ